MDGAPWVPMPTLSVLPGQAVSAQVRGVINQPISGTVFAEHLLPALPSARATGTTDVTSDTHSTLGSFQPDQKGDVKI